MFCTILYTTYLYYILYIYTIILATAILPYYIYALLLRLRLLPTPSTTIPERNTEPLAHFLLWPMYSNDGKHETQTIIANTY